MSSTAIKEDIELLIKNKIILTVGSKEAGETIGEIAKNINKKVRVHLKIDTGFGRYGFIYSQKDEMVKTIKNGKTFKLKGYFHTFQLHFMEMEKKQENNMIDLCNALIL